MSRRFARALLALALVVPVVVVFSPTTAGARPEYAAGGITEVTHSRRVVEGGPDARIRRGTGVTVGNDIYWPAPQRVSALVRPLGSVIYWVTIENEAASAQRFRLWGARSSYFRVSYYTVSGQPGRLGEIINRGVVRGMRLTPRLEPGEIYRVGMRVTIPLGLPMRFHRWQSWIRVYSTTQPGLWDQVGAITIRI